jgi:hypothetical protein
MLKKLRTGWACRKLERAYWALRLLLSRLASGHMRKGGQ